MDMAFLDNYRFLGRYNRWMNQRLYAACEALTDAERKQKRGAFFSSIHHTLTHLVMADKMWLQRFAVQGSVFAALPAALLAMPEGADYSSDLHRQQRLPLQCMTASPHDLRNSEPKPWCYD